MSRYPYYRRYHADALEGMSVLTPEQRGVYNTWLDLIYKIGGPIAVDTAERWQDYAAVHRCSVRKLKSITDELAKKEKLVFAGGFISNRRATVELGRAGRPIPNDFTEGFTQAADGTEPPETDMRSDPKTSRKSAENEPKTSGEKPDPNENSDLEGREGPYARGFLFSHKEDSSSEAQRSGPAPPPATQGQRRRGTLSKGRTAEEQAKLRAALDALKPEPKSDLASMETKGSA